MPPPGIWYLHPLCLCSWGREGSKQVGEAKEGVSGKQAPAAHEVWPTLIGRAYLSHLVLLNLSHQHTERMLQALRRRARLSVELLEYVNHSFGQ